MLITPEQKRLVLELVRKGDYATECEVIDEALKSLQARDRLRDALQAGLDELDRGEGIPASEVFAELKQHAEDLQRIDP